MQWLKSLLKPKAAVTTQAIPIPAAIDLDVPRYPPFMKGLPTIEPERLIGQHPEILSQFKRSVIVTPEQYERFYLGALRRFATYAHLLPASQSHHHRGAGGLLRHSMEVALWSLQGADNMLLSTGKTPAQRRAIEPRWQLTAFLAGLCHDVGKPATDMTITDSDRNLTWKPLTENLYDWAKANGLNSYFLDWRAGRGKQHISLSNLLAERIIGAEALQWIDEGGTELVVWLMEALSGNPGATNPLYDLVLRADSSSTERDLKTMGVAMAGYELGVPIERHLMDIMRRLIKEGIWQVNELGARVWNINGGIYLMKRSLLDEIPEVDEVLGTTAYDRILDAVDAALAGQHEVMTADLDALPLPETKRLVTTGGHFAYLKIAEGCDKHCTYCIIPKIRGNFRSVPMERLLKEAQDLAEQGVKELILVAQETTLYGKDLYGEKSLPKLLRELCKISGIRWIRILYCYPEEITDELIQVMKEEPKICHYLDLPIQHANDTILKRMGRRTSKQELIDIVQKLRKEIPDICLRTTLITGFPGETQEQHEEVMEFIDTLEFDRLGAFTYSPEEDTPAATFEDQIDEEVKEDRQADIMELQQEIAFDKAEDMIGREVLVMIEGKVADENAYVGRTYRDAPNVDGLIFINTDVELISGDFAKVKVTGALDYDLIGELM